MKEFLAGLLIGLALVTTEAAQRQAPDLKGLRQGKTMMEQSLDCIKRDLMPVYAVGPLGPPANQNSQIYKDHFVVVCVETK
jgi:hypothetical protein